MANDVTEYGRKKVTWPDLASDPGQTLHNQVTGSVANISNQLSKHWSGLVSIAAGQANSVTDQIIIKGDYLYNDDGSADNTEQWDYWHGTYQRGGNNSIVSDSEFMYYDGDTQTLYTNVDSAPQDFGNQQGSISGPPVWYYAPRYSDNPEIYGYDEGNRDGWNIIVYYWWSFTNEGDPNFDQPLYGCEGWSMNYTYDDPTDPNNPISSFASSDYPDYGTPFYTQTETIIDGKSSPDLSALNSEYNGIDYSQPFITYGSILVVENFVHNLDTPLAQLRYFVKKDGAFLPKVDVDDYFDIQEVDNNTISLSPIDGSACDVELYVEPNMYVETAHFADYFFFERKDCYMAFEDVYDPATPKFGINSMRITFRRINNTVFWSTTSQFYMRTVDNEWNYAECNLNTNNINANDQEKLPQELRTTLNAQEGICGYANIKGYIFSFKMQPALFTIYCRRIVPLMGSESDQTGWSGLSGHYMIN